MIKTFIFDLGKVIVNFDHSRIVQRIEQFCDFNGDEIYGKIFASTVTHDYDLGKISSLEFFEKVKNLLNLRMNFNEFADTWNSTFDLEPILSEELIKNLSKKYRLLILSDSIKNYAQIWTFALVDTSLKPPLKSNFNLIGLIVSWCLCSPYSDEFSISALKFNAALMSRCCS